ncbi:PP0621 family protein [Aquabacterium soli]|jgi:uncharacterized protein|uniref:PP0621 family protein n=1 Tax=Aquabacterium soli TaxID=2493092 RepID=UPI00236753F0|nr:PP0621 family protein [Aquabacterium soli]
MTKFLLLVLLIVAVLWGPLSRLRKPARQEPARGKPAQPPTDTAGRGNGPQDIVPCAYCGVHLPRREALPGPEHGPTLVFCCAEHRRLGPRSSAT